MSLVPQLWSADKLPLSKHVQVYPDEERWNAALDLRAQAEKHESGELAEGVETPCVPVTVP